jgi:hypothetical protein
VLGIPLAFILGQDAEVVADEFVKQRDADDMPVRFHFIAVSRGQFELLKLL